MLGEKDLIYFGALLLYQSNKLYNERTPSSEMEACIETATKIYDKIFKEN